MSEEQTPTHCPHCGAQTAFGSHGYFTRTTKILLAGESEQVEFLQQWFQYHCPECDNVTAMLEKEEPVNEE